MTTIEQPAAPAQRSAGRTDWGAWPTYDAAALGFTDWWYPVEWSDQVDGHPRRTTVCGTPLVVLRDADGTVAALHDRCPHRGVPLSEGTQEFPGTVTCPYHGWTYRLGDGQLCAVITDGPDSPICGKVSVRTFPVAERAGLVWVFVGEGPAHDIDDQLPEEWAGRTFSVGGRIDVRKGNWRLAAENGYDEGHAKYLHRTSWWRLFKVMPTWNKTHIEQRGRWLYRVQDEVHWSADFPGVGHWSNQRWWKLEPPAMKAGQKAFQIGNTGGDAKVDPVISGQAFPGFASISLPGVLRIVYPQFIHYEFYVPIDADTHRYVGVMVQFKTGARGLAYKARYLGGIRWLFHGNFSGQDAWMVEATDCPPERLYRPDSSLLAWRRLCERGTRPGGEPNRPIAGPRAGAADAAGAGGAR